MFDFNDPVFRFLFVGALLSLPLKVVGLWRSARNNQKGWFAAMLLVNSVGLLEVTYLFYFSNKSSDKNV